MPRTEPNAPRRIARIGTALIGLLPAVVLGSMLLLPPQSFGQAQPSSTPPSSAPPPPSSSTPPPSSAAPASQQPIDVDVYAGGGGTAADLVHVPVVTGLYPGNVPIMPNVTSPVANDPEAPQRGLQDFLNFNCVGCHAANGAGGMGPALSNRKFIYGSEPQQIYLSILQGRPNGMPAWGGMLPDAVIWDLVAYIRSISQAPTTQWGKTTSATGFTVEQVPAEQVQTADPWKHTERFGYGQAPNTEVNKHPGESASKAP